MRSSKHQHSALSGAALSCHWYVFCCRLCQTDCLATIFPCRLDYCSGYLRHVSNCSERLLDSWTARAILGGDGWCHVTPCYTPDAVFIGSVFEWLPNWFDDVQATPRTRIVLHRRHACSSVNCRLWCQSAARDDLVHGSSTSPRKVCVHCCRSKLPESPRNQAPVPRIPIVTDNSHMRLEHVWTSLGVLVMIPSSL